AHWYSLAKERGMGSLSPVYLCAYGACLVHVDKPAEGLALLEAADRAARSPQQPPDPPTLKRIADAAALACDRLDRPEEAAKWRHKAASQPAASAPTTLPD